MTRALLLCCFLSLVSAAPAPDGVQPHWTRPQAARLVAWLDAAADDALEPVTAQASVVRAAIDANDQAALDAAATDAATRLLEAHRHGCCGAAPPSGWHIADTSDQTDAVTRVAQAVAADRIDALFESARPTHPYYRALRAAYQRESDPARRASLAANLDRWRWMPRTLGTRYLLVNTAAFEATLWEDGRIAGRWRVVTGKTTSPTPVFAATVTGVILNPWWEIPPSIAREGIAALLRNHPAQAAAQGYVVQAGRYRQRPGANNALGRMKLIMPNGYSIYLHDTPEQKLFAQDARAYSHGCVRVDDALGLVAALLAKQPGWGRAAVAAAVATGQTRAVALAAPIPVYIAYFTAEPDENGNIRYMPDVYHRDPRAKAATAVVDADRAETR